MPAPAIAAGRFRLRVAQRGAEVQIVLVPADDVPVAGDAAPVEVEVGPDGFLYYAPPREPADPLLADVVPGRRPRIRPADEAAGRELLEAMAELRRADREAAAAVDAEPS